jgi:hypothetical protein
MLLNLDFFIFLEMSYYGPITVYNRIDGQEQLDIEESMDYLSNKIIRGIPLSKQEQDSYASNLPNCQPTQTRGMEESNVDKACRISGIPPHIVKITQKLNHHLEITPAEKEELRNFCKSKRIPVTKRGFVDWVKGIFGGKKKKPTTPTAPPPPPKPELPPGTYSPYDLLILMSSGKLSEYQQLAIYEYLVRKKLEKVDPKETFVVSK